MKVAFISSLASSLINFRGALISELVKKGHEVIVFAPDFDTDSMDHMAALGALPLRYRMARTGMNPVSDLIAMGHLVGHLRKHKPDIVFSYFIKPVIYGSLAAKLTGVPRIFAMMEGMGFVFTNDSGNSLRRFFLQRAAMFLFRLALRSVNKLILLNKDDYNEFVSKSLVSSEKAVVLGGIGIDLKKWIYSGPKIDPLRFIFVGRLLKDKGIREFAAAAKQITSEFPNVKFTVIGARDDNPSSISIDEVEKWVSCGYLEWLGHVSAQEELQNSSVFVLPSYREGVPCSTQEAMATGLPVITTDVPGCRETVVHGENGLIVPVSNVAALAAAMRYFIINKDDISVMGQKGRKMAVKNFDVIVQNRKIMDVIGIN